MGPRPGRPKQDLVALGSWLLFVSLGLVHVLVTWAQGGCGDRQMGTGSKYCEVAELETWVLPSCSKELCWGGLQQQTCKQLPCGIGCSFRGAISRGVLSSWKFMFRLAGGRRTDGIALGQVVVLVQFCGIFYMVHEVGADACHTGAWQEGTQQGHEFVLTTKRDKPTQNAVLERVEKKCARKERDRNQHDEMRHAEPSRAHARGARRD